MATLGTFDPDLDGLAQFDVLSSVLDWFDIELFSVAQSVVVLPNPSGGGWSAVDNTADDEECILLVLNGWLTLK